MTSNEHCSKSVSKLATVYTHENRYEHAKAKAAYNNRLVYFATYVKLSKFRFL